MRDNLIQLIKNTLLFQFSLPNGELEKTIYSTHDDHCYSVEGQDNFVKVIYNSLIEYSFSSKELQNSDDFNKLMPIAIYSRFHFNTKSNNKTKISYGFYGEVVLYSLLKAIYGINALVSRGFFYNPTERGETKGYDAYHIVASDNHIDLWFGEAKFYQKFDNAIKSVMENLEKALSDEYLKTNLWAIIKQEDRLENPPDSMIKLLDDIKENPEIKINELIRKYDMTLVYPILIICNSPEKEYRRCIQHFVNEIKFKYSSKSIFLSIPYKIFFIFMPIDDVKTVKEKVIECIETKSPLLT